MRILLTASLFGLCALAQTPASAPKQPATLRSYLHAEHDQDATYWANVAARTCTLSARAEGYSLRNPLDANAVVKQRESYVGTTVSALHVEADKCFQAASSRDAGIPWETHLSGLTAKDTRPGFTDAVRNEAKGAAKAKVRNALGSFLRR